MMKMTYVCHCVGGLKTEQDVNTCCGVLPINCEIKQAKTYMCNDL